MPPEPTWARRQLADHLRTLRTRTGASQDVVAAAAGLPQSKVSAVERARSPLTGPQLAAWLHALDITGPDRTVAEELLDATATSSAPWRSEFRRTGQGHTLDDPIARAAEARRICEVQTIVVPGLLQTAAYTRAMLPLVDAVTGGLQDNAAVVRARQAAQDVVYDPGERRFEFILTEKALAGVALGEQVMAPQRARLESTATLDHVAVHVLPDESLETQMGFVLFDEVDGDGVPSVGLELPHGPMAVWAPEDVQVYRDLFDRLRAAARPI